MALSTTSWVGFGDVDVDVDRALEGGGVEVGGEREGVAPREDRARQAMGVGHGARLLGVLGQPRPHHGALSPMPRCVPIRSGGSVPTRPPVASTPVIDTGARPGQPMDDLDVVGIGNALVDVLTHEDDAFIEANGLVKGSMTLIDTERAEALYAAMGGAIEASGGSAANTISGIASFGGRAAYIGRVFDDQLGAVFAHDLRATRCRVPVRAGHRGPAHRALPDRRHARRRAHDEHLPRRVGVPRARGRRRRPDRGRPRSPTSRATCSTDPRRRRPTGRPAASPTTPAGG